MLLITGATGLVGQKCIYEAQRRHYPILALSRRPLPFVSPTQTLLVDLTYPSQLDTLLNYPLQGILHTAAMANVDACQKDPLTAWLINVEATHHLLKKAETLQIPFIYVSTDFVFDGKKNGPYREEDPISPLSTYAKTKAAAEMRIQISTTSWAIARTILVYGVASDLSRDNILLRTLHALREKKPIPLFTDQVRMPTWAEDLACGLLDLYEKKAQGIFHLSGPEILTPYDMGLQIAKMWDLDPSYLKPVTSDQVALPAPRPQITTFDISRAQKELGYKPHTLTQALTKLKDVV
ncbi:MAG: SDR family oxidoreductase [Bacteroidia bacterium]